MVHGPLNIFQICLNFSMAPNDFHSYGGQLIGIEFKNAASTSRRLGRWCAKLAMKLMNRSKFASLVTSLSMAMDIMYCRHLGIEPVNKICHDHSICTVQYIIYFIARSLARYCHPASRSDIWEPSKTTKRNFGTLLHAWYENTIQKRFD